MKTRSLVLLFAVVVFGASAAIAATGGVPVGSPGAIKAAFAHGPGPWNVPVVGGNSKPAAWPDACKLLNLAELKALVPGTASFKTQGQHGQFLGGGETPHFALCKYSLRGSYDPAGYPPSFVEIELRGVADPAAVAKSWSDERAGQAKIAKKYPDQYALYNGRAKCFWDGNELQCIAGKWNFWVLGQFIDKTGSDTPPIEKTFRTKALVPLANGLATRMK